MHLPILGEKEIKWHKYYLKYIWIQTSTLSQEKYSVKDGTVV